MFNIQHQQILESGKKIKQNSIINNKGKKYYFGNLSIQNQTTMQWIIMVLFKYQSYETNCSGHQWNLWVIYTHTLSKQNSSLNLGNYLTNQLRLEM